MGTRSLTKVMQTWEDTSGKKQRKPITCMYRQHDGYLNGHGQELAEWLSGYTIVNGIPMDKSEPMFNGMDCLAAQMFAHFKNGAGGIYCMHPDAEDVFEDYLYEIEEVGKDILITVYEIGFEDGGTYLLQATPEELLTKIEKDYA
jgi:hypothetical protein